MFTGLLLATLAGPVSAHELDGCRAALVSPNHLRPQSLENTLVRSEQTNLITSSLVGLRILIDRARQEGTPALSRALAREYSNKLTEAAGLGLSIDPSSATKAQAELEGQESDRRAKEESAARDEHWQLPWVGRRAFARADSVVAVEVSPETQQILVRYDRESALFDLNRSKLYLPFPGRTMNSAKTDFWKFNSKKVVHIPDNTREPLQILNSINGASLMTIAPVDNAGFYSGSITQDGSKILTVSRPTVSAGVGAILWNTETGKKLREFPMAGERFTFDAEMDPLGRRIVTSANRQTILWDAGTGEQLSNLSNAKNLWLRQQKFAANGRYLTALGAESNTVYIFDAGNGSLVSTFVAEMGACTRLEFNEDGTLALTASEDKSVRLWDVASGTQLRQFDFRDNLVLTRFVQAGSRFITLSARGTLSAFDLTTGSLIGRTNLQSVSSDTPANFAITSAVLGADESFIVTIQKLRGSIEGEARIWRPFSAK